MALDPLGGYFLALLKYFIFYYVLIKNAIHGFF